MDISIESVAGFSLLDILREVGPVGYGILFILLGFSIVSWGIILYKYRMLKYIKKESQKFLELYNENSDLGEIYAACVAFRKAPVVRVLKTGYLGLQRIRKEMMTSK